MKEKKYCIYCGSENDIENQTCSKCNEDLNPKENLFVEFLISKTKDKFKGSIQDSVYDAIMNFLYSHLYGALITVSVVSYAVVSTGAVDVISKVYSNHIEIVEHAPNVNENNNELDESQVVLNLVEDYVESFKNSTGNGNMEANSGNYETNLAYDFESIKDPYMVYNYQYYPPNINSEFPTGTIAENLYANQIHYAQVFMGISNGFNENIGTYVFTLVKENDNWLIVEADKVGTVEIITMEEYAYNKANNYRSYGTFTNYETYTDAQYQEFIAHRLPSSYGYNTSHEFKIDRFMPEASGCLNYTLDSSGISPSNPQSNIGPKLLSDGIMFVEYVLTEDNYGPNGYMGIQKWLIVVGYFDSEWYVVEDRYLGEELAS